MHTTDELRGVASLAQKYGVRVVVDEIHAPLVLPGATFTPYLSLPGAEDAFSLVSASKAWNLAGLKAALLVAGPAASDDLARVPEEVSHGPSHLGVIAHAAAFRDGGDYLDALLAGLDTNRRMLSEFLSARLPQLGYIPLEGTYLAWIDCTALNIQSSQPTSDEPGVVSDLDGPAKYLLDEARVAVSSGHVFGTGGRGHIRLNIATSPAILHEALERIATAFEAVT